jgi:hypothetical protein
VNSLTIPIATMMINSKEIAIKLIRQISITTYAGIPVLTGARDDLNDTTDLTIHTYSNDLHEHFFCCNDNQLERIRNRILSA